MSTHAAFHASAHSTYIRRNKSHAVGLILDREMQLGSTGMLTVARSVVVVVGCMPRGVDVIVMNCFDQAGMLLITTHGKIRPITPFTHQRSLAKGVFSKSLDTHILRTLLQFS